MFCILVMEEVRGSSSRFLLEFELVFRFFHFSFCMLVMEEVKVGAGCLWTLSLYFDFFIFHFVFW